MPFSFKSAPEQYNPFLKYFEVQSLNFKKHIRNRMQEIVNFTQKFTECIDNEKKATKALVVGSPHKFSYCEVLNELSHFRKLLNR